MEWLSNLNKEQFEAVTHENGPLFVVAGAGTGKTRTLTCRLAYLIGQGNDASRILAVTFTNKAAKEMKDRVMDMVGPHAMSVWIYTFHAFGLQILRRHIDQLSYGYTKGFNIADDEDSKGIIRDRIKELNLDIKEYSVKNMKSLISNGKCQQVYDFDDDNERMIFESYHRYLRNNDLVDFDDLLLYTLEIFTTNLEIREKYQNFFQHILVDEFQDTDKIQYEILFLLGMKHKNVFVVGDPDQSIYSFRGANYENNKKFIIEFGAKEIKLEKNYRSTNNILKVSNNLIKYNVNRPSVKELQSDLGTGLKPNLYRFEDDLTEAYEVAREIERLINNKECEYRDIAVLYRSNALSRTFEDIFIKFQIPYVIYGGISFYERKEIKDVLAYIRLMLNPSLDFYFKRIINIPKRSIGNVTLQKLEKHSKEVGLSMFHAIDTFEISGNTKTELYNFKKMITDARNDISKFEELKDIIPYVIDRTKYMAMLKEDKDEMKDRIQNIGELQNVFVNGENYYEGTVLEKVTAILDQIALYSGLDKKIDSDEAVILTTIHQVKGLEYKVVFIVALNEGIFPSELSLSRYELEEERRVAYVGITRAKERLYLTTTKTRMLYGKIQYYMESQFIKQMNVIKEETKKVNVIDRVGSLLKCGDKVEHSVFGNGVVISVEDKKAKIAFPIPHGIKTILEDHPSLRKLK